MLNGDPLLLSHGWRGKGFLKSRWDTYSEMTLLYLLADRLPRARHSARVLVRLAAALYYYGPYEFISGGPLFTHQDSHAWIDYRNRRDRGFVDFF